MFVFNDTATTEIYTLSLHDALPISEQRSRLGDIREQAQHGKTDQKAVGRLAGHGSERGAERDPLRPREVRQPVEERRSEEHTSELQSRQYLVCRLLLDKQKLTPDLP